MRTAKQQRHSRLESAVWPAMPVVVQYEPHPAQVEFADDSKSSFKVQPGKKKRIATHDVQTLVTQFLSIEDPASGLRFLRSGGNFLSPLPGGDEKADYILPAYEVYWSEVLRMREVVERARLGEPILPFTKGAGEFGCGLHVHYYAPSYTPEKGLSFEDARLVCKPRSSLEAICMSTFVDYYAGMRYARCASERCGRVYRVKSSISRCCSQECARQVYRQNLKR